MSATVAPRRPRPRPRRPSEPSSASSRQAGGSSPPRSLPTTSSACGSDRAAGLLGLAAAIPLYFASDQIRECSPAGDDRAVRSSCTCSRSAPRTSASCGSTPSSAIVAPLLGLAFAFDAVNSERSEGTLPRLLSQPIYRDDVINGKFLAGLGVIGIVLISVVLLIAGFGMFRLGIVPHGPEVLRLIAWVAVTFLYVALWLSFGLLLSVAIHRAATAALVGFGVVARC